MTFIIYNRPVICNTGIEVKMSGITSIGIKPVVLKE